MATPSSPTQANFHNGPRRTNTVSSITHSVASVSQSAVSFTENLVLHSDPPLGFFAATAEVTSKAPTVGEIRRGSFGQDGWNTSGSGSRSRRSQVEGERHSTLEPFAPLTEEPSRISDDVDAAALVHTEKAEQTVLRMSEPISAHDTRAQRTDHDRIRKVDKGQRVYSSGYIPPPKIPWTTSTSIALKAFGKWVITPFGFLLTLYGLNVVAWGGMLFLLLCNASPAMCWAPVHNRHNQKHLGDAASLALPGPYYFNCNDINSSRRIWLEIDSQILNALFCVTGFGLVPWRFRDLYYLLKWRLTSERKHGKDKKMYGLRVLAGIHRGWFRLPGSETLDIMPAQEYLAGLDKKTPLQNDFELEAGPSALSALIEDDPRIALPVSKNPADPATSVRAPPTKLWKLDFFIWSQVWNTFFQCCLCGFMWGMDRYTRPPWSTGLFIAFACIIAGAGGIVSFVEGKRVKRVEGVAPPSNSDARVEDKNQVEEDDLRRLRLRRLAAKAS